MNFLDAMERDRCAAAAFSSLFVLALNLFFTTLSVDALNKDEDIDTNRPSFMDSPLVVPQGSLQLENGTLYQHSQHGITYYDIPETEVRAGLTQRTEFQMFVPNWVLLKSTGASGGAVVNSSPSLKAIQTNASSTLTGVTNLGEVGIKRQFHPLFGNLITAFIGGVNIPTGRRELSARGVQPVVRYLGMKPMTKNWSFGGMQSILVVDAGRDVEWQNFWMLSRGIGARSSAFIEYAGFYTHHAFPINIIHFGAVHKLNKNNQLDMQFGFGLDKTAPAAFVGVGYSCRFDRLPALNRL